MQSLVGLFAASFLSATILPGASEVVLAALLIQGESPERLWLIATIANTLGSTVNWFLGRYMLRFQGARWFPFTPEKLVRAERWFEARGVWTLTLAWVPIVGDALTFVAGLMRTPLWMFIVLVGIGKGARYAAVIYLLSRVT